MTGAQAPPIAVATAAGGIACRLCGGPAHRQFVKTVLRKYQVTYYLCGQCGSLQTEAPYWLDEAYRSGNLADIDPGPFIRSINSMTALYISARIIGLPPGARVVDFGGGVGLLCRMLRDIGFDAYVSDRYATNALARGFDDTGATPDLICAFEVAEHFSDPREGMAEILGRGARVCVVGTDTYRGHGEDWWYLSPLSGQHVFFYSESGMRTLADYHGYHYEKVGNLHYFLREPLSRLRGGLLWRVLSGRGAKWVRGYLALGISNRFAEADVMTALRRLETAEPGKSGAAGHQ